MIAKVIDIGRKNLNVKDAVAGFTFSRLPRGERIAKTLAGVLSTLATYVPMAESDLLELGNALAPYAEKDFAVRYGWLESKSAPTQAE